MTTLKDLSDKQVEDLKSKVEGLAESNPERGTKFSCGKGKARWDNREMSRWNNYGHDRLYFANAEDSYIDLKEGEVVGNDHSREIFKINGFIVSCVDEYVGGEIGTEYSPTAIVPEEGVEE